MSEIEPHPINPLLILAVDILKNLLLALNVSLIRTDQYPKDKSSQPTEVHKNKNTQPSRKSQDWWKPYRALRTLK